MKKSVFAPVLAIVLAALMLLAGAFCLRDITAQNGRQAHLELMKTLSPGSETFTLEPYSGEDANIQSVHKGEAGFVVETVTYGYAGNITMYIGVSNAGRVTGLVVYDLNETPGLGRRALTDHEFLAQFLNGSGGFTVAAAGADAFSAATDTVAQTEDDPTQIDALTGATVTTKAIVRCVNSAVGYVTGADAVTEATAWGG